MEAEVASCRLFRVTFDGRLVTRLNLRRIEYIAETIPISRASGSRDVAEGAFEGREGGREEESEREREKS